MSTVRQTELNQKTSEYIEYLKDFFGQEEAQYEGPNFNITYENHSITLQYDIGV